jgi:hypothetical protein
MVVIWDAPELSSDKAYEAIRKSLTMTLNWYMQLFLQALGKLTYKNHYLPPLIKLCFLPVEKLGRTVPEKAGGK